MTTTLARTLRRTDLLLLVIGTVIGSGIFIVPATVLAQTGRHLGLTLMVWIVAGVLSCLGALSYGELGAMKPEAGGLYVYVRDAFGPLTAFLYGWAMFFVIASGSLATLAVAFARYASELLPIGPLLGKVVAVTMIAVIAVVNVRGTRQSAGVQNWTTATKVAAILSMSVALLARGKAWSAGAGATDVHGGLLAGVGAALVGVLWAYEGWQYVTFSAGEAKDPQRTFPAGIVGGTAAVVGIYLLANLGYLAALGPAAAAASPRIAAEAVGAQFGPAAGKLIALAILLSMFSAANGLTLSAPRVYYAMARDGVFFRRLGDVHPRFGTPAVAVIASSLWAALLALSGTFEQLLTYVVFAGWAFYALGALALFHYRRAERDTPRPFRVPGYPWTPALFVLSAAGIVVNTFFTQPRTALIGAAFVCAGAPAYALWRRGRTPAP